MEKICLKQLVWVPYKITMHRRIATLLLVLLFAGGPVLSAIATTTASSDLPACCRKDGAHRCAMRRGQAKQEDGMLRLTAACPFTGKTTLAVAGQRMGIAVGLSSTSAPVPASRVKARPRALVLASNCYFENSQRGPPSVCFPS
jgi:hypothetical protein